MQFFKSLRTAVSRTSIRPPSRRNVAEVLRMCGDRIYERISRCLYGDRAPTHLSRRLHFSILPYYFMREARICVRNAARRTRIRNRRIAKTSLYMISFYCRLCASVKLDIQRLPFIIFGCALFASRLYSLLF